MRQFNKLCFSTTTIEFFFAFIAFKLALDSMIGKVTAKLSNDYLRSYSIFIGYIWVSDLSFEIIDGFSKASIIYELSYSILDDMSPSGHLVIILVLDINICWMAV